MYSDHNCLKQGKINDVVEDLLWWRKTAIYLSIYTKKKKKKTELVRFWNLYVIVAQTCNNVTVDLRTHPKSGY